MADPNYEGWRQVALLTSIPMVLMAGPIIGYWMGDFLDRLFETSPWLMGVMTIMGGIASVRQTILLIKRVKGV